MADEGRKRKMQRKKGANLMKNLLKKFKKGLIYLFYYGII